MIHDELRRAVVLDHNKTRCQEPFLEEVTQSSVLYIQMKHYKDFSTWILLAKCLKIWDLDARGFHKGMWRIHYNRAPLFIIGSPFSEYS